MTTRTFLFTVIVLCGCSAAAHASGPNQKKEDPIIKVHKEEKVKKDKHHNRIRKASEDTRYNQQRSAPVSVPDGDSSAALLLTVGAGTVGVAMALARRSERKSRQPGS